MLIRYALGILSACLLLAVGSGAASAQDKIPLAFGQWVSGELTNDAFETDYTFSGKAGQLVTIVMMADPDGSNLDTFLTLQSHDGETLGQNDDVLDHIALVVARLPADGDYTVLATRYKGSEGDTEGKYWIKVSDAELLSPGTKTTVSIVAENEKNVPGFYVYIPDSNGPVKFGFNVAAGDSYPQIGLFKWKNDDYPDILIQAEYMRNIGDVSFSAELKANDVYVLMVDPVPVFYNSDEKTTLTFRVG